jgi:A/G-specific adenine glycosylase
VRDQSIASRDAWDSRFSHSGLLAGMWELPSSTLSDSNDSKPAERVQSALAFVKSLVGSENDCIHSGEVGIVPWLFSHLKLTMHVHLFKVKSNGTSKGRWATKDQVEDESMGTGMRKCWSLVKDL